MKTILKVAIFFLFISLGAQSNEVILSEIQAYQAKENAEFMNPDTSILTQDTFAEFTGLEFYPIDLKFRVEADLVRTPNEVPFLMPTTTERLPEYVKYGEAHFEIDGEMYKLNLYKNTTPYDDPEYVNYLFLPFTDLTSGDGSYGGGRYVDAWIPEGDTIVIDFNRAYNPYCAYNSKYSCPIPPKENDLLIRIEAGVKDFGKH